jgi:cell division protease FtsH
MPTPAKAAVPLSAKSHDTTDHPRASDTSADRIARHLIRRLQHEQLWKRVEAAQSKGLLNWGEVPAAINGYGYRVRRWQLAPDHGLSGDPVDDLVVLRRMFLGQREGTERTTSAAMTGEGCQFIDWRYLLALLGRLSSVNDIFSLAVVRLLSRALADCGLAMTTALSRLNQPGSLILIRSEVEGFTEKFVALLKAGFVTGRRTRIEGEGSPAPASRTWEIRTDRTIRLINDEDLADTPHRELEQQAAAALSRGSHVLVLHGRESSVPPALHAAADLVLTIRPTDRATIEPLLDMLHGSGEGRPTLTLPAELTLRRLDNLMLALRPSRSREDTVRLLHELAQIELASGDGGDIGSSGQSDGNSIFSSLGSRKRGRNKAREKPTGSQLIQPEPISDASTAASSPSNSVAPTVLARPSRHPLTVETLSGYGEARDWALDLKSDLELWRGGAIEWEEMSTRLLLSGPPGTGKTTFARALCNSLQLPMLATSVATWLQPGYLGDVLKRMSGAFEDAREYAPSILFIDECDAIGSRQDNARDNSDYWNTVIARMLELLDGAARTSGVIIVGATNRPEFIDKALTRSGRLEKQVVIPKPDVDALCNILAHHVGSDLASVLETAPPAWTRQGEAEGDR